MPRTVHSAANNCSNSCAHDPTILRFECANAAFHVIVGTWEVLPVVALHQVRAQVGEHLQELGQALLLLLGKRAVGQVSCHLLSPAIQAASYCFVPHALSRLSPTSIQNMLNREHPAVHACDLCQLAAPLGSLSYDVLQAGQFLFTLPTYRPPFFASRCRLASTASRSLAVWTAAKSKGAVPSRLSAESIPAA